MSVGGATLTLRLDEVRAATSQVFDVHFVLALELDQLVISLGDPDLLGADYELGE